MLARSSAAAAAAMAALAAAGMLTACGSAPAGGGSQSPSASPSLPRGPAVTVHLGPGFSPGSLRLRVGQQFLVVVSRDVRATGLPGPGGCARRTTRQVAGGLLSARCTARGYRYTALHAGHGELSATVRPRCAPGNVCPQWITAPTLKITIS